MIRSSTERRGFLLRRSNRSPGFLSSLVRFRGGFASRGFSGLGTESSTKLRGEIVPSLVECTAVGNFRIGLFGRRFFLSIMILVVSNIVLINRNFFRRGVFCRCRTLQCNLPKI